VKKRVGYLPDNVGFYEDMTGKENLLYTAALNSIPREEADKRVDELLELVGLTRAANQKAGTYSRGMRQRLGLADVLVKQPEVIILDEPTLGIDPQGVRELLEFIHMLSKQKQMTVLLSSHQLHQVQQICDRVGIFVRGQLLAQGPIDTLSEQLFKDNPVYVELTAKPCEQNLLDKLQEIPEVLEVKQVENRLLLRCSKDPGGVIASAVLAAGADLLSLHSRRYGLDDIYRKYFEGRETA
jgi:ABC-2 type transport system ATP-binding protein